MSDQSYLTGRMPPLPLLHPEIDYLAGLTKKLGDDAACMIVAIIDCEIVALRASGADTLLLTREHLLSVATHLQGVHLPALLPGITVNISPSDYNLFKQ